MSKKVVFKGIDNVDYTMSIPEWNDPEIDLAQLERMKDVYTFSRKEDLEKLSVDRALVFSEILYHFLGAEFCKAYPEHGICKDFYDPVLGFKTGGIARFAALIGNAKNLMHILEQIKPSDLSEEPTQKKRKPGKKHENV